MAIVGDGQPNLDAVKGRLTELDEAASHLEDTRGVVGDQVEPLLEQIRTEREELIAAAGHSIERVASVDMHIQALEEELGELAAGPVAALKRTRDHLVYESLGLIEAVGSSNDKPEPETAASAPLPDPAVPEPEEPSEVIEQDPDTHLAVEDLIQATAIVYGVAAENLLSKDTSYTKRFAAARNTVAYLAHRERPDLSWSDIGKTMQREGGNLKRSVETGGEDRQSFAARLADDADLAQRTEQIDRIAHILRVSDPDRPGDSFTERYLQVLSTVEADLEGGPTKAEQEAMTRFQRDLESMIAARPSPTADTDPGRYQAVREIAIKGIVRRVRVISRASGHADSTKVAEYLELPEEQQRLIQAQVLQEAAVERLDINLYRKTNRVLGFALLDAADKLTGTPQAFEQAPSVLSESPEDTSGESLEALGDAELARRAHEGDDAAIEALAARFESDVDDLLLGEYAEQYESASDADLLIHTAHDALRQAVRHVDPRQPASLRDQLVGAVRKRVDQFIEKDMHSPEVVEEFATQYVGVLFDRYARYGNARNFVNRETLAMIEQATGMARSMLRTALSETDDRLHTNVFRLSGALRGALVSRTSERLDAMLRAAARHPKKPVDKPFGALNEPVQCQVVFLIAERVAEELMLDRHVGGKEAESRIDPRILRPPDKRTRQDFARQDQVRCPPFLRHKRGSSGQLSRATVISSHKAEHSNVRDYVIVEVERPDGDTERVRFDVNNDLLIHEDCYGALSRNGKLQRQWRPTVNRMQQRGAWPPLVATAR